MVLFYIVIDFSPTSTTTNARFACALYLRPEGQSFTALFDKMFKKVGSPIGANLLFLDISTVPRYFYCSLIFYYFQ
ncbi:hypothetical protein QRO24_01120 [Gallibacterium anatis]|uniref:Uncharacterized protein n=2 Tax=Gallibacterium anatis TaxID=750 RepID=F4HDB1_GALAU|nr:hypothetical protein [Gallibacterium anatis]AEC16649.1 hypothetical protein UMN179_00615 [Gallibacterium anatis UMN179]MBP4133813.1 hypothetical protein [Gallibacterium anatis]MDK9561296.1 hypothetical protein [Gallibacterium anatis]